MMNDQFSLKRLTEIIIFPILLLKGRKICNGIMPFEEKVVRQTHQLQTLVMFFVLN